MYIHVRNKNYDIFVITPCFLVLSTLHTVYLICIFYFCFFVTVYAQFFFLLFFFHIFFHVFHGLVSFNAFVSHFKIYEVILLFPNGSLSFPSAFIYLLCFNLFPFSHISVLHLVSTHFSYRTYIAFYSNYNVIRSHYFSSPPFLFIVFVIIALISRIQ